MTGRETTSRGILRVAPEHPPEGAELITKSGEITDALIDATAALEADLATTSDFEKQSAIVNRHLQRLGLLASGPEDIPPVVA